MWVEINETISNELLQCRIIYKVKYKSNIYMYMYIFFLLITQFQIN